MYRALSIDLGTTSRRAVLTDDTGRTIAADSRDYETITTGEGRAEQRPRD